MSQTFVAPHLDVKAFAKAAATLSGQEPLSKYERLMEEAQGSAADPMVDWQVRGEVREDASGHEAVWMHLSANVDVPQICQRCLAPTDTPVAVDRFFRFVATEALAQAQDDESEEDLLVLSRDFNLKELIEDELLMSLPIVPRHEVCPTEVKLAVQDPDFEAAVGQKQNPFAVLAKLQGGKSST